jgi:hypothetical protein
MHGRRCHRFSRGISHAKAGVNDMQGCQQGAARAPGLICIRWFGRRKRRHHREGVRRRRAQPACSVAARLRPDQTYLGTGIDEGRDLALAAHAQVAVAFA